MEDLVTIYSGERGAYWAEDGKGYASKPYAGVFTRSEAVRLTSHCGPEKRIEIHDVSEDHIPTLKARLSEALEGRDALQATITACEKEVALVYWTLTNGKFSKMNTQSVYILTEVDARIAAGNKLLSSVLSVRKQNTDEWMFGIAEDINAYAESTGEPDRVVHNGDGLSIVKGDGNGNGLAR